MRKLLLLSACAALAACGGTASDAPAEAVAEEEAAPATTAADGGASHGTFVITRANGDTITEVLSEDGTFTATNGAGEVTTGTWEQKSPNEFCSKDDDEDEMTCFAEEVNAEGVWTSTDPDDGEVSTVERVVEDEASEESDAMAEG